MTSQFFFKYLFSRAAGSLIRTISWIGLLGVATGVMSMVVVLSIMNGLGQNMKQKLLAVEPHLIFRTQTEAQQDQLLKKFALESDADAFFFEEQDVLIRTSDGFYEGAIAKGMHPDPLIKTIQLIQQQEIKLVNNESLSINDGEIFIGMDLARSLGIFEEDEVVVVAPESLLLPPGEVPKFDQVKVVGIIDVSGIDSNIISKTVFYKKGKTFAALG